ncbi:hypothetical protein F6X40_40460 [Paraburkholderia sp. UCT31]|uniref:hypothetical protein n=1 Tax=Paraburkholderia sp. UCT31 TaxID=2615209 RepID=UPI0016559429|nr:hypothetical protein [Paraburkholderia sp. UCT31]MBC8742755.1 hypothetical protein [Paraburkholderia sp. UCT31]
MHYKNVEFELLGEKDSILWLKVPCSKGSGLCLRRTGDSGSAGGILKGLLAEPVALNDQVEAFCLREDDIRRIQADADLMRDLTYLLGEREFTLRPVADGFELRAKHDKTSFTADLQAAHRVGAGLDALPRFELPEGAAPYSFQNVQNYLTGWLMLSGVASLVYLYLWFQLSIGGLRVLSYTDLILPALLMTVPTTLLLAGVPLFCLRKSPFVSPLVRQWGIRFWLYVFATSLSIASIVDSVTPGHQQTLHYAGKLYYTSGKRSIHYYLRATDTADPVVFGESARTVRLTASQYDTLEGFPVKHEGVFEVTFDQGVLHAPYVVGLKRVRTEATQ